MSEYTGDELATQVCGANYDPDYLVGYFVTLVGHIADGSTVDEPAVAARKALERMADFESHAAEMPFVVRKP